MRLGIVVAATLGLACGDGGPGEPPAPLVIASGVFDGAVSEVRANGFPQIGGFDYTMSVNRAAGRVEFRYTSGSATVVEYWTIVGGQRSGQMTAPSIGGAVAFPPGDLTIRSP